MPLIDLQPVFFLLHVLFLVIINLLTQYYVNINVYIWFYDIPCFQLHFYMNTEKFTRNWHGVTGSEYVNRARSLRLEVMLLKVFNITFVYEGFKNDCMASLVA